MAIDQSGTSTVPIFIEGTLPALDGSHDGNYEYGFSQRDLPIEAGERKFVIFTSVENGHRTMLIGPVLKETDSYYHRQLVLAAKKIVPIDRFPTGGGRVIISPWDMNPLHFVCFGKSVDLGVYPEAFKKDPYLIPVFEFIFDRKIEVRIE